MAIDGPVLAIFDLDGTITRRDTLLPYLRACLRAHPWRVLRVPYAIACVLGIVLCGPSRARFKGAVLRGLLGGMRPTEVEQIAERFVPALIGDGLYAEAIKRISWHRAQGHRLYLLSASTDLYVPLIGEALGFDASECSRVRWRDDGRLDGRLATANRQGKEKARLVSAWLAEQKPSQSFAYGNTRGDLAHLWLVTHGFYVNGPADWPSGGPIRTVQWQRPGTLR